MNQYFETIKPVKTGFVWIATGFNLLGKKESTYFLGTLFF